MEKQITKPTAKQLKEEAMLKDKKRAEQLIKVYTDLKAEQDKLTDEYMEKLKPIVEVYEAKAKPIQDMYKPQFESLTESLEEAKEELIEIGERNKNNRLFGTDGNWNFEDCAHYLHQKQETVAKLGKEFSLDKFIKRFAEYVDVKFKIADLKRAMVDGDMRKKFERIHFDLGFKKSIELKQRKEKA